MIVNEYMDPTNRTLNCMYKGGIKCVLDQIYYKNTNVLQIRRKIRYY